MGGVYVLEQLAKKRLEVFQLRFARDALELLRASPHIESQATQSGLRLRADGEDALADAVGSLLDRYGTDLHLSRARVLYQHQPKLMEPIMRVLVRVPQAYAGVMERSLVARGATGIEVMVADGACDITAQAPMAGLLGYSRYVRATTGGKGKYHTVFSHYSPFDPGGSAA